MKSTFSLFIAAYLFNIWLKVALTEDINDINLESSNKEIDQEQTKMATCEKPLSLYTELEIPNEGLLKYRVVNSLDGKKTSFKPSCLKYDFDFPDVVYEFKILRTMEINITMSALNKSSNLDCVLAITNLNCTHEQYCSDSLNENNNNYYQNNNKDKEARLVKSLSPGHYKLIATGFYLNDDTSFELNINFAVDRNFQYASGSCNNPIKLITENSLLLSKKVIFNGKLQQDTYQIKLPCSNAKSSGVVYSFQIPDNAEFYFEIKAYEINQNNYNYKYNYYHGYVYNYNYDYNSQSKFKLDTVLAITDSTCHTTDEMCNDDSDKIEGLSSFLSGILNSGKYNLIVSGYDIDTIGSYGLEVYLKLKKLGDLDPIKLSKSIFLEYNGSFSLNNVDIDFNCNNYKQSSKRFFIVPLENQNGKAFNATIKLKGIDGKNKMDTFIEIRDNEFSPLECNDDSKLIGGLSSYLTFDFYNGSYILIIGVFGEKNIGYFNLMLEFNEF